MTNMNLQTLPIHGKKGC